ncbi:MAG: glycine cleavage system protein GcvH [Candidatus Cloacimonetes bacterium]|nr:glycine cleavage system protein GcvH [Candidatus Cloacimonadota bacterium]MBS3767777.1 glycine cleavage system protein GcvH [Candidatus Cloacimonadota bacterium]
MVKDDLYYTENHEWVQFNDDSALVGITDYAQNELGDVVFVELPEKELKLEQDDVLATIEAVKAVEEIYSPVSGVVLESNLDLEDNPELINSSPYEEGWIAKIELDNKEKDMKNLISADEYRELIGG